MEDIDTILVIDDSSTALLLMEYALNEAGYSTHTVTNVRQAIDYLNENNPRLILLDLSMPEISGFDFLNMRSELHLDKTPIIVVSAFTSQETIHNAMELGANDFVPKPILINALMEKIKANY